MNFTFTDKTKRSIFLIMGVGLVLFLVGVFTSSGEGIGNRIWADLLTNGFLFFGVGVGTLFFLALQYAAEAAWGATVKRVMEGVMTILPIGMLILIVVFIGGTFQWNHIYPWMDNDLTNPASPHFDEVIAEKSAYLNLPFFWIRVVVFMGTFFLFFRWFRKKSLEEDLVGGTAIHYSSVKKAALFLVLFAVFSSVLSWDWVMSIDVHWYSTLFGWYTFTGFWLSAVTAILIITLYLKSKGLMDFVNENHIHDLGKWMFALSFLWTYMWFCQFMLIWYGDIPEETPYFIERIENFKIPFFLTMLVNFVVPLLFLMSRDSKRNYALLLFIALIVFVGRFMDVTLMIMPGTEHHFNFGFMEIGMFVFLIGVMLFTILRALSHRPLIAANHPYLEESKHLHY